MEYFEINGFPDYRLVRESEKDFYVESCKKGEWEKIGSDDGTGHIYIQLYKYGVKRGTFVHTIVAEMFVPNPDNKEHVHHIDGNATNNDPANLMWVTNSQHKAIHNKLDNPMRSEATRKKLSESMKGKHPSEEACRKMSEAHKGKRHSEESRKKMSEVQKGKNLGRPRPKGAGKPPKPVERISPNDEIKRYESAHEASRQTGISLSRIIKVCNGAKWSKTAGGYKWRYAD